LVFHFDFHPDHHNDIQLFFIKQKICTCKNMIYFILDLHLALQSVTYYFSFLQNLNHKPKAKG